MKKKEIVITVILACAIVAALLIVNLLRSQNKENVNAQASASTTEDTNFGMPSEQAKGEWIAVIHRNKIALWFDSGIDNTYSLTGDYGEMTITVKDLKWCVSDVECPNHNCEQMGWDDGKNFVPITCIPNNVIICTYDIASSYMESYQ